MEGKKHPFRICEWCETSKPLDDFFFLNGQALSKDCKDCSAERKRLKDYHKSDKLVGKVSFLKKWQVRHNKLDKKI